MRSATNRTSSVFTRLLMLCAFIGFMRTSAPEEQVDRLPDFDELLKDLKSAEFDVREKATRTLAEYAEAFSDRLQPLSRSEDPEIQIRYKTIMRGPAETRLARWDKNTDTELKTICQLLAKHSSLSIADSQKANELERYDVLVVRKNRLIALREQLKYVTANPRYFSTLASTKIRDWDPRVFSFEDRLDLELSLKFEGVPWPEAMKQFSEITGIPIEFDPSTANTDLTRAVYIDVNARRAEEALLWICSNAELIFRVDRDRQKAIVMKKKEE